MLFGNRFFSAFCLVLALSLLSGCEFDLAGLFPSTPSDPTEFCAYNQSSVVAVPTEEYAAGNLEIDESSSMRNFPRSAVVSSGECTSPLIRLVLSDFESSFPLGPDGAPLLWVIISFHPNVVLNQEYILNSSEEESPIQVEMQSVGRNSCLSFVRRFNFLEARIKITELPQKITEPDDMKLSFSLSIDGSHVLKGQFSGVVPLPRDSYFSNSDPVQCEREYNAVSNYRSQLATVDLCQRNSDCILSDITRKNSCIPLSINKNATSLDALRSAVEEHEEVFPYYYDSCYYYGGNRVVLPVCETGHCKSGLYEKVY